MVTKIVLEEKVYQKLFIILILLLMILLQGWMLLIYMQLTMQ